MRATSSGSLLVCMGPQTGREEFNFGKISESLEVYGGESWCLGGDFNDICFPGKRNREDRIQRSMRRFSQIIDELELKDLPIQRGQYTWKGGLNNQRMARLNRFLFTDDWEVHFEGAKQSLLPKPTSDHHPILLEGGGSQFRGPTPFIFENMWFKERGLKNLIYEWGGIAMR